jgi:cytoplasmic iron level regulating protein YaaA (DUF328/UPF0246 family)
MIVLIHSSKTMRADLVGEPSPVRGAPVLLDHAVELVEYVRTLPPARLGTVMGLSADLAAKTHATFAVWTPEPHAQVPAVDAFLGDIYSGLRAATLTAADRAYAHDHLRVLSGLYGILRAYDGIRPYRLEMGYRLPDRRYASLYGFWGTSIADQLPPTGRIVNLAANEYSRAVLPAVDPTRVVTPKFLTKTSGTPRFVAVHAKIARGAFARWLVVHRGRPELTDFAELGYRIDPALSTPREPCFVCAEFGGKGLSVRLT